MIWYQSHQQDFYLVWRGLSNDIWLIRVYKDVTHFHIYGNFNGFLPITFKPMDEFQSDQQDICSAWRELSIDI